MRQTLSDSGAVLGNTAYDPWGVPQQGSVPTFGFTGELQQGSNVYLRARWYNAASGTFTSRDPFAGMPEQPYSLMPYQYAYSAPTTWTDASGLCAVEGQGNDNCREKGDNIDYWRSDTTIRYIHQQMMKNAQGETVAKIKQQLDEAMHPPLFTDPQAHGIACTSAALILLAEKVRDHGDWDHKPILEVMLHLGNHHDHFYPLRGDTKNKYYFDIWSNVHFGFVGSAAGFGAELLHFPNDVAGAIGWLPAVGTNNPGDKLSVQVGIDLWNTYGLRLTPGQLRLEVLKHKDEYVGYKKARADLW